MKLNYFSDLFEFFAINKRLVTAMLVAASIIGVLQLYVSTNDKECLGIIDSKESTVTYDNSVLIKNIFVMPGETVERGQPLIEVEYVDAKNKTGRSSKITYAQEDATIASVFLKPRERAAPFQVIISFTPAKANLVYGFIHENRVSEFKTGDEVIIEAISDSSRSTKGKVISLGKRVVEFPQRFQNAFGTRFWGRELMVAIKPEKKLLTGEKVRIRTETTYFWDKISITDNTVQAGAISNFNNSSKVIAVGLDLEASGLAMANSDSLLIVSDSKGPKDSPFWRYSLDDRSKLENLSMEGVKNIDDLESVSISDDQMYALSSLSIDRKNKKVKTRRKLLVRFNIEASKVIINRALDLRTPMLEALKNTSIGDQMGKSLNKLEVEAFSVENGSAFFALKRPQMPDGSSVILKIENFAKKVEEKEVSALDIEIYTILKLKYSECLKQSRITDMLKTKNGLLVLSTCNSAENISQIWWLQDDQPAQQVTLLDSVNSVLEGMTIDPETKTVYLSSDHGKEGKGSDLMKVSISHEL